MSPSDSLEPVVSYSGTNDFEIVEHFSDDDPDSALDDLPPPTFDASGFPKPKHRSESEFPLSKPQEYEDLVLKQPEQMTEEEIKEAQSYLYKHLGQEMCDFIKERKLKRMEESELKQKEEEQKPGTYTPKENELIFTFDNHEFQKYQWMNPSESISKEENKGKPSLHELRFNFEGFVISNEEDGKGPYEKSLYNHGLDSDKPGYTFPELLHLSQSSFKPQVQISVRTLSNVLLHSYDQSEGEEPADELTCFFSYPQYRWNNYIDNDLELFDKCVYLAFKNQTNLSILIDSLSSLSLLVFGNLSPSTNEGQETSPVVPVQDVLFDYHQFYSGVDCYYWNPLFLDLMDTNLYSGADPLCERENLKDEVKMKEFYKKSLEGHYQTYSVEEIRKEVLGFWEERENEGEIRMSNRLVYVSKYNLAVKLLLIMKQYQGKAKIQEHALNTISGLVSCFGTPLAQALSEFPMFRDQVEEVAEGLLEHKYGTESPQVTASFLYLVKYLSIYLEDLNGFFDSSSAVSVIKESITEAFMRELGELRIVSNVTVQEDDRHFKRCGVIALKCMTVWAIKGYVCDSLDEFVPVFNLAVFKIKDYAEDEKELKCYLQENWELLGSLTMHFSTCVRLKEMGNHFKLHGVVNGVSELLEVLSGLKVSEEETLYLVYTLVQFHYDYLESLEGEEEAKSLELPLESLVKLGETMVERCMDCVDLMEGLLHLSWFDETPFSGLKGCKHNQNLIQRRFNKVVLQFVTLNLVLNALLKAKSLNLENERKESVTEALSKSYLKRDLFKLGGTVIKSLKNLYYKLHSIKEFQMNSSIYLVKPVPVFESWLVYLTTVREFGFENADVSFAAMALSVDYSLLEEAVRSMRAEYPGVDQALESFRKFNKYLSSYSLGTDRQPLVSFLSYVTCLPLQLNLNGNLDFQVPPEFLCKLLECGGGEKIRDWYVPSYLFSQLVYTLASKESDELFSNFNQEHYRAFQKILFENLSAPCDVKVEASEDLAEKWADALDKFELNEDYKGKNLSEYFKDDQEMATYCSKLVARVNSGLHDSPVTLGLLMLFTSYMSTEECSRLVWSEEALMLLMGRNLEFDFETFEISSTVVEGFRVGNMFTFSCSFGSEKILRSQRKLLETFSDSGIRNRDPVLFLALLSVWKNSARGEIEWLESNTQSALVKKVLNGLLRRAK